MNHTLELTGNDGFLPASRARAAAPAYQIQIFRDLKALEPHWRRLDQDGHATVFQTWAAFQSWVCHIAGPQRLNWVVVGLINPQRSSDLMLLPLCVRRDGDLRVIEFADLGVSDFNGPVFSSSFRPSDAELKSLWSEVLDVLPAGDLLRLSKLPETIGGRPNPLLALPGLHRMNLSAFGTPLGSDWRRWANEAIDAKLFKDIEARTRKLEKRGKVAFAVTGASDAARAAFAAMCEQRAARHAVLMRENILARPGYSDFYRALFATDGEDAPAMIASLSIDGDLIATGYGLVRDKSFHMIFPTFKAEGWRNYSPGLQLFARTMRWAIENGFTYFDFTIGGESFKRQLGAVERPLYEKLVPLSPRGLPAVMSAHLKRIVRQRSRIPVKMLTALSFQTSRGA